MIIDSSAVIAILRAEPPVGAVLQVLDDTPIRRISAADLLEIYTVVDRVGHRAAACDLEALLNQLQPLIEPVTEPQVTIARVAYQRFGKGSGHRAGLNFGDCFAYALAKAFDEPLLFVGNDFAATDIPAAWHPAAG